MSILRNHLYKISTLWSISKIKYKKSEGFSGFRGEAFEFKTCALLFARATKLHYKFKLASSADGFGKFDDIIFNFDTSKDKFCFLMQLKNKSKDKIRLENLLSKKHDFGLENYYNSYIQIRKRFENQKDVVLSDVDFNNCMFVLYTNAQLEDSLKCDKLDHGQMPLELANAGGNVMKLNKEQHKTVFDVMEKLPDFQNFIDQFYILYNQPNEDKFDTLIKSDIRDLLNLSGSYEDTALDKFKLQITEWWKKQRNSYFLTEEWRGGNPLYETMGHVEELKIIPLLKERKLEIEKFQLKFCDHALEEIKHNADGKSKILISTDNVMISICKLNQIFFNAGIFKILDFEEHASEILSTWKNGTFDVLILYNIISSDKLQSVCQQISNICQKLQNIRVILIVERQNIIKTSLENDFLLLHDDAVFSKFDLNTRNKLMNTLITFQGIEFALSEFGENVIDYLDGSFLSFLMEDKRIVGSPLSQPVECYINRTLESNRIVDCNILSETGVIFCLHGGLESGFTTHISDEIYKYQDGKLSRFIWVDDEQDFETICKERSDVLWLERRDKELILKRSYGAVRIVDKYLNKDDPVTWVPRTLLDGHENVVVVTAVPGMGKSTLLTHLSIQTKQQDPHLWIVRININDYTNTLNKFKKKSIGENNVIELLEEAAKLESMFEKQLFKYCWKIGNIIVLADGLDEISPDYSEVVYQILKILFDCNIRRIWITSRSFLKSRLESLFGVRSYEITPFSKSDQKEFVSKMCKSRRDISEDIDIDVYIDEILKLVEKFLNSNNNNDDFTGIPLQIFMLAEVFGDTVKCTEVENEIANVHSILGIYDNFFDGKWKFYNKEKKKTDLTNIHVNKDDLKLKREYIENCKLIALLTLFSNEDLNLLTDNEIKTKALKCLEEMIEVDDKVGLIISVRGERAEFLHRTVAEYFAAKWLFDQRENNSQFLKECIFRPEYIFTRRMLDYQLAEGFPLHLSVLNGSLQSNSDLLKVDGLVNKQDRGGRTPLHLAVMYQSLEETKMLLHHGADEQIRDIVLSQSSVDYASCMYSIDFKFKKLTQLVDIKSSEIITEIMKSRPETRNTLCDEFLKNGVTFVPGDSESENLRRMLHYYVNKGGIINVNVMQMLIIMERNVILNYTKQKTVPVYEISNSRIKGDNAIADICKGARFGLTEYTLSTNERMHVNLESFPNLASELFFPVTNNKHLAGELIRNGLLVNTVSISSSDTLYYNVVDYFNVEMGKLIGRFLTPSNIKLPIHLKSSLGVAVENQNIKWAKLLLQCGAPVITSTNEAPICVAIRMGHVELCKLLLEYEKLNDLHFPLTVAIQFGKLEIVKEILTKWKNKNINAGVISSFKGKHLHEIINFLLENLVRLNYREFNLCVAAECGFIELVKLLVELGEDINKVDELYGTPLIAAAQGGQFEVVTFLLSKGARVNMKDKLGKTALHASACSFQTEECASSNSMCRFVKICSLLIKKGADVNAVINISANVPPLNFALYYYHFDVVKCLLNGGAEVNKFNYPCDITASPLNFAIYFKLLEATKLLLSKHELVNCQVNNEHVPLCLALRPVDRKCNYEIMQFLLDEGANVNITCNMKCSPLLTATVVHDITAVQILLNNGADVNVTMYNVGWSPLHIAVCLRSTNVTQLLLKNGASLNLKDKHGRIPLHFAVCNSNFPEISLLLENNNESLMVADENGWTPVLFAAKFGLAHLLRGMECGLGGVDKEGRTALFMSALNGHVEDVKFLLGSGADVNITDDHGLSPLHVAACGGHLEIVELLLKAGARADAVDKSGFIPVDYAEWNNHGDVLKLFKVNAEKITASNNELTDIIKKLDEWNNRLECEIWNECFCNDNLVLRSHFDDNLDQIMRLQKK